jgi:NTP pyrophosphatase (non-canonical NTP hydrolase)
VGFKSRHPDHNGAPATPGSAHVRRPIVVLGCRMEIGDLQARIEATFGARDRARGVDGTFRWWVEEVGEVAKALRGADPAALDHELGDALAWLVSVANVTGVDLNRAAARYADGCPRCHHIPCTCPPA